jgi:hypothetical protein
MSAPAASIVATDEWRSLFCGAVVGILRGRPCIRGAQASLPIVGDDGGIWSFVHLEDAAAASVLALERDGPGINHIVGDQPAHIREWLPAHRPGGWSEATPSRPALARARLRWRGPGRDGDRESWCLEREGKARARLDPASPKLETRLHRRVHMNQRGRADLIRRSAGATAVVLARARWRSQPLWRLGHDTSLRRSSTADSARKLTAYVDMTKIAWPAPTNGPKKEPGPLSRRVAVGTPIADTNE